MIFGPRQKLLFIGDSITSCYRRSEAHRPYGNGYVHFVRALLLARYPALALIVENRGKGGETVRKLAARWDDDVIAERPDWLSVMIGVGDVWLSLSPARVPELVPLDEYDTTYRRLLTETARRTSARLILMEPFVITSPVTPDAPSTIALDDLRRLYPALVAGANAAVDLPLDAARADYPYLFERAVESGEEWERCQTYFRAQVDQRRAVIARLAREFDAILVPTQVAFDHVVRSQPPWYWALDRFHANALGHAVIARAFLRATGYGDV